MKTTQFDQCASEKLGGFQLRVLSMVQNGKLPVEKLILLGFRDNFAALHMRTRKAQRGSFVEVFDSFFHGKNGHFPGHRKTLYHPPLTVLTKHACQLSSFWGSRCDSSHAPTISLKSVLFTLI